MSRWLREKAERNRQALARLSKRLPTIFPPAVLARALGRPFIPPTPRLAIEFYWRAHPIRADRLARALAARTGPPVGWTWRISQSRKAGLPATFRTPPAPYRERAHRLGPGYRCVCGQPVYRLGWHRDLWDAGPNTNAVWHCACVVAWQFWNAPNSEEESSVASKGGAVAKPADDYGRAPRLTTAFRCFECGPNTGGRRGREAFAHTAMVVNGTLQTFQSHPRLSAFGQERTKSDFGPRRGLSAFDPKRTLGQIVTRRRPATVQ